MTHKPFSLLAILFVAVLAQATSTPTCQAQDPTNLRDALGITDANPEVTVDFDFGDATYFIDDGNWSLIDNEFSNGIFDIRPGASVETEGSTFNNLHVMGDLTLADRFTGWSTVTGDFTLDGVWENQGSTVNFVGDQFVGGNAVFQFTRDTQGFDSSFRADGATFGSDVTFRSLNANGGNGRLVLQGGVFDLEGRVEADGGNVSIFATDFTNRGTISATNGGFLDFGQGINNEGHVEVIGAGLSLDGGLPFSGTGTLEIRDSVLSFQNMTVAELNAISGTNLTYAPGGFSTFDLGGTTLNIADEDGQRWALGQGFRNGTIESTNGFELQAWSPAGVATTGSLSNVVLNADLRIGNGTAVSIEEDIQGSGNIFLDGGSVTLTAANGNIMGSEVLDLVEQISGTVWLNSVVDNSGKTITFRDGVDYYMAPFATRFPRIIGGRIEAESELQVKSVTEANFRLGSVTVGSPIRVTNIQDGTLDLSTSITFDNTSLTIGEKSDEHDQFGARTVLSQNFDFLGTGEIRFEGNGTGFDETDSNSVITFSSGGSLTIGSEIDVVASEGSGQFSLRSTNFTNNGSFKVDNGHSLKVDSAAVTVNGLVEVGEGSSFVVTDGDLTLGEDSSTALTIGSTNIGRVGVSGQMNLDGSLSIDTSNAPTSLPEGFEITMMQANLRSGIFNSVSVEPFTDDLTFAITYSNTSVLATSARIGDVNLSQSVTEADDVAIAVSNLGFLETQTWTDGDIDGDGKVTAAGDVIEIIARVDTDLKADSNLFLKQNSNLEAYFDATTGELSIFADNVDAVVLSSASGALLLDPNFTGNPISFSDQNEIAWLLDDAETPNGFDSVFAAGTFFTGPLTSDIVIRYTTLGSGQVLQANITSVPEPAVAMIGLFLFGLSFSKRRQRHPKRQ